MSSIVIVGVLALQGAFVEHVKLLNQAAKKVILESGRTWDFREIRTLQQLEICDALIIPGGESTTIALAAARSGLLEPLRNFVKVRRRPTWGTCAGLILLAESANQTKKGGQDLIGGLDVRVNRNYFGRQTESFEADMNLSFLEATGSKNTVAPFRAIFIRAPVVEKLLPIIQGQQTSEKLLESMVVAPSRDAKGPLAKQRTLRPIEIMATLPGRSQDLREKLKALGLEDETGDVVAVKQGNVFGTSFHPELTQDARIHVWWLQLVRDFVDAENEI